MKLNNSNIPVISQEVKEVLSELQQRNGVAEMYVTVLTSLFNKVLSHQGEMELSDHNTLQILRTLRMLLDDVAKLSRMDVTDNLTEPEEEQEDEPGQEEE